MRNVKYIGKNGPKYAKRKAYYYSQNSVVNRQFGKETAKPARNIYFDKPSKGPTTVIDNWHKITLWTKSTKKHMSVLNCILIRTVWVCICFCSPYKPTGATSFVLIFTVYKKVYIYITRRFTMHPNNSYCHLWGLVGFL